MMNLLFILQYLFLNGFLIHHFFLKTEQSWWAETLVSALLLSICLNSLSIYLLSQTLDWPITKDNVIILSLGLASAIVLLGQLKKRSLIPFHR